MNEIKLSPELLMTLGRALALVQYPNGNEASLWRAVGLVEGILMGCGAMHADEPYLTLTEKFIWTFKRTETARERAMRVAARFIEGQSK